MRPCGSKLGVLHGLCRVQKKPDEPNGLPPLRPVLSAIVPARTTFLLVQQNFSYKYLKEFTVNEHTVKDSFSFSNNF